jgi:tRNA (cmo5U34)-methyltransferase
MNTPCNNANKKDVLFAKPHSPLVDFAFSDAVADVFPDMIRRSVPGYDAVIALLGVIAAQYVQDNSRVYDLGTSLGASTLAIYPKIQQHHKVEFICVDNSDAMIQRCRINLQPHMPKSRLNLQCADIEAIPIENASFVMINFTLQFLPPAQRLALLKKVYAGLRSGAALVISEKLSFDNQDKQQQYTQLHHHFKRANGYSDLEISQKRAALDNVLIPDTLDEHIQRLETAGFTQISQWFQSFNFASLLAIK